MKTALPDLSPMMPVVEGFSHPRWDLIFDCVNAVVPEAKKPAAWTAVERQWLEKLCGDLGADYRVYESKHFLLVSETPPRLAKGCCKFFEKALGLILKYLPGVAKNAALGKQIVLKFSDEDDYNRYTLHFFEDGTHPMSGGMCITSGGCLHYAFPVDPENPSGYRTTLVHELTHGCLNDWPLPVWLHEALAMRMEQVICGTPPMPLDRFILNQHRSHWNAQTMQQFWSGESWNLADQGFQLSYGLAQIIWNKIENEMRAPQSMILDFITRATQADAGEAACREVFDLSLGDFVEDFLGEGEWSPHPPKSP